MNDRYLSPRLAQVSSAKYQRPQLVANSPGVGDVIREGHIHRRLLSGADQTFQVPVEILKL